jgi:hypothetical protein
MPLRSNAAELCSDKSHQFRKDPPQNRTCVFTRIRLKYSNILFFIKSVSKKSGITRRSQNRVMIYCFTRHSMPLQRTSFGKKPIWRHGRLPIVPSVLLMFSVVAKDFHPWFHKDSEQGLLRNSVPSAWNAPHPDAIMDNRSWFHQLCKVP